jgi:hypothetical protein
MHLDFTCGAWYEGRKERNGTTRKRNGKGKGKGKGKDPY